MRHSGKKLINDFFSWKESLSTNGKNYGGIGQVYK